MQHLSAWLWVPIVLAGACVIGPDRPDPNLAPGAITDEDLVPIPNNCATLEYPFDATAAGWVEGELSGFAVYEYRSTNGGLTTVQLRMCDPEAETATELDQHISLLWLGLGRIEPGTYPVSHTYEEDGGFAFAYTDGRQASAIKCNDQATGEVTITDSDYSTATGSFEVDVRCIDAYLLDRIPRHTVFTGTFVANNVGQE